jgi:hypothetical protein
LAVVLEAGVVARRVTVDACSMVLVGTLEGLALGTASVRYIETLFYQGKATDLVMLPVSFGDILATTLLATRPPAIYALGIDPVTVLRAEQGQGMRVRRF